MGTPSLRRPAAKVLMERLDERDLLEAVRRICRDMHVLIVEVLDGTRTRDVVRAREACVMHMLQAHDFSSTVIGSLLGLDHSSVLSIIRRVRERQKHDQVT